jgi:hypothetical protein
LHPDGTATVVLILANPTTGDGKNTTVKQITFSDSRVSLSSPTLPLVIGTLPAGLGTRVTLTLKVPTGLTNFSITESGTITDYRLGNVNNFSTTQSVVL